MQFVQPDIVSAHFHLHVGDSVADFGAGAGYFMRPLAKLVSQDGVVYACEIQKKLTLKLNELAQNEELSQVRVLWCDLEELNGIDIESDTLDAGIVVNTLFQLDDKSTALTEMVRTLRSGGKLFIIDWSESFDGLGPTTDAVVSSQATRDLVETAGLVFERDFPAGEHHYGLAFRKP